MRLLSEPASRGRSFLPSLLLLLAVTANADPISDDATTSYFNAERGPRTRPTGVLSTSLGAFVTSGTTTEYLTKILGTYIKGTYARIISTSSKVYHPVPQSEASDRPTGFITATTSTEVNGYGTTLHRTDFYRTYIDGTYAQLVSSTSQVTYPSWYTDRIEPTASDKTEVYPTTVRGSFQNQNVVQAKAYAEVGIVPAVGDGPTPDKFRVQGKELKVKGTHGKFIHSDKSSGEETTYNVFTGSYVQNSKTYLFFFGNSAIAPTKADSNGPATLSVENGPEKKGVLVDMTEKLKVIVPSGNSRVMVSGALGNGERMPGVLVEIEGSEPDTSIGVDGAERMGTPSMDLVTITKDKKVEEENEIPRGRKVPDVSPSPTEEKRLPTFTVGQVDTSGPEPEMPFLLEDDNEADMMVEASTAKNSVRVPHPFAAPVFQKTTEKPVVKSTDRIRALGYTAARTGKNLNGRYPMPNRSHKAFSAMFSDEKKGGEDLSGEASTGRATVTYVGFADFTTTVGNTVIVFMPRTKMIEDLSAREEATRTQHPSQRVEPTRYSYDHESTTTEGSTSPGPEDDHVQFSVSHVQGRKVKGSRGQGQDEETTTELNPSEVITTTGRETLILPNQGQSSPKPKFSPKAKGGVYQTASTKVFQTEVLNPTGLVTSIDGTLVKEGKTTLYTSLVYGTFIGKSYAQVIKSSSRVVSGGSQSVSPSRAGSSQIKPTSTPKAPVFRKSSVKTTPGPVYYEFSTTHSGDEDEPFETTTERQPETTTKRVTTTTTTSTSTTTTTEKMPEETTTAPAPELESSFDDDEEPETTTLAEDEHYEVENEIGQRKVAGGAKDQVIVDKEEVSERETIYITKTLPTTVFRTYTYYTTFFIPEEGTTSTKVVSREVTSSKVGHVRKTLTSVLNQPEVEASVSEASKPSQVIYKTLYTTYTYLTTFFSGHTSSVSSREETVSNVVTLTSASLGPSKIIVPTGSSSSASKSYKTRGYSSSVSAGGHTPNLGSSSPSPSKGFHKTNSKYSKSVSSSEKVKEEEQQTLLTKTLYRTFMTTYTYFTTLFNGDEASTKSRTEVITNVVPYLTKTVPASMKIEPTKEESTASSSTSVPEANNKETTFYTTYTYLSTIFRGRSSSTIKTSKQTYTNIVLGGETLRSGYVESTPTEIVGRSAASKTRTPKLQTLTVKENTDNDLDSEDELDSTTSYPASLNEYELEGSEDVGITTNAPEGLAEEDEREVGAGEGTPVLKTLFTTYTFYTTYYKGASSTVSSRLETKSQVVTDTVRENEPEVEITEDKAALLSTEATQPITYYTTYTYWTTSFKDGSSIVTSREETVTNVVSQSVSASESEPTSVEIVPTTTAELELTTFYTTYTYFTTSYLGDNTVVNSRLETVTNVITGTVGPVQPTLTSRAIGGESKEQKLSGGDEYEDYATGLLSTIVSSKVKDGTTTLYSTDVYGTLIDGIYAQVLESTSKIVKPSASAFTRFFPDAKSTATGVVSVNEGKTVEAGKDRTTWYATTAYGTLIDGKYAHIVESSSSMNRPLAPSERQEGDGQKTGLVRVIDGTLVEGDQTTFYTSSILGTFVDGQYAQVIESTSRIIIAPTKSAEFPAGATRTVVELEASVTESSGSDDEEVVTTTTSSTTEAAKPEEIKEEESDKRLVGPLKKLPPRRFGGGSRLTYSPAKTNTPSITPFASRSRPSANAFVPRGRRPIQPTQAAKDESTPTSTSAATSPSRGFGGRRRFQSKAEEASSSSSTPTPALPASVTPTRGRFSKTRGFSPSSSVSPNAASSSSFSGSSAGARGKSSFVPGRGRPSASISPVRGSASSAIRGGSSASRFIPGRRSSALSPSSTQTSTVTPTESTSQSSSSSTPEYEEDYSETPSSSTTTEKPVIRGPNRFRLNNKLSTPSFSSGRTTTSRPVTTRGSPLGNRRFSKPTIPTRATTTTTSAPSSTAEGGEGEYEYAEEGGSSSSVAPSSSSTAPTLKPIIGRGGKKPLPVVTTRPTTPSRNRGTTTPPATTASTTRRTYTPRPRPAGFPRVPVGRSTTTTTSAPVLADDEYYEEGEFEYQESKHPAVVGGGVSVSGNNGTQSQAASELSEVRVSPVDDYLIDSILKSLNRRKRSSRKRNLRDKQ